MVKSWRDWGKEELGLEAGTSRVCSAGTWCLVFAYNLEHSESATRNACLGSTPWLLRISLECNMGIRMFWTPLEIWCTELKAEAWMWTDFSRQGSWMLMKQENPVGSEILWMFFCVLSQVWLGCMIHLALLTFISLSLFWILFPEVSIGFAVGPQNCHTADALSPVGFYQSLWLAARHGPGKCLGW